LGGAPISVCVFFDDGYTPFPTIHKTDVGAAANSGNSQILPRHPIESERSTKFFWRSVHKPWRRRRPAALPVQCHSDGRLKEGLDCLLVVDGCDRARPVRARQGAIETPRSNTRPCARVGVGALRSERGTVHVEILTGKLSSARMRSDSLGDTAVRVARGSARRRLVDLPHRLVFGPDLILGPEAGRPPVFGQKVATGELLGDAHVVDLQRIARR